MYNKIFKKGIAFLLSAIITISAFPLNIVFANLQSHITNLNLQSVSSENQTEYTINFSWTNPSWSNTADGEYSSIDAPSGFKLEGANTTKNSAFEDYLNLSGSDVTSMSISSTLNSGSIYEFKVTPYHYHKTSEGNSILANYDNSKAQETVLFMTDIQVEATGSGNRLIVTFDNPQYKGTNLFDGYKIYYQRGGSNTTNFTNYKYVTIDDPQLVISTDLSREGVQRLTYVVEDANITQGDIYSVKVEPIYNNSELRETGDLSYKTILVNNSYKKISFRSISDKEYRVNNISVSIPLDVKEDGESFLKLNWGNISNSTGTIERIEIYSGEDELNLNTLIGTIYSSDAIYINNWRIDKPSSKTYYKILVYIEGFDTPVVSEVAIYDPKIVSITPNRPDLYLYNSIVNNSPAIDIYWDVFLRYPYTEDEKELVNKDGTYIDTNITYDIWISDSITNLKNVNLPKIVDTASATEFNKQNIEDTTKPVYYYQSLEYFTLDSSGSFVKKSIQENTTYYVKIIARKPVENQVSLASEEAISQIYISTNGNISTPQNISKPPLKIKTDTDGLEQITQTEINIEWRTRWFEIYDEATNNWYSKVAIRNDGIVFGDNILETDTLIQFYDKYNEYEVKQEFLSYGLSETFVDQLQIRQIDLTSSDIKYELQVIDFETISIQGGYEAYIQTILNDENSSGWTTISPTISEDNTAEYKITKLTPNTLYAILLRPYRVIGDNKKEAYPTYILGTTLPNEVYIEIQPTTPQLFEVEHDDTSITVNWVKQGDGIVYELAINEINISDPSQSAILISSNKITEEGFLTTENLTSYINYEIKSLFPSTGYYIWIRAVSGNLKSEWSTNLYVKTDEIYAPDAPSGFGLASQVSVDTHNSINNTDLVQADQDYIIVEWLRDEDDNIVLNSSASDVNYELLSSDGISHTYSVMFKNLVANKYYNFRVKTVRTLIKNSSSDIQEFYSYVVQASLTKDFLDSITVTIPNVVFSGDKVLIVESEWSDIFTYKTTFTKDNSEYDGNVNDSMYPLPTEDFEIIYDGSTQTLTYRFRSNQKDANGNADNLVDQRFISTLLANKVYDYVLDLTSHNGYQISNRVVEIPYTIFKALEERQINLHITAGNTTFVLKSNFLNTDEVKNQQLGYGSTVRIAISQSPTTAPILTYGQSYSTTPQKISIYVSNNVNSKQLSYTGTDIDIVMKLKNRYLATDTNVSPYIQTQNNSYWQRISGDYNVEVGSFTVKSRELATYSVISTQVPNTLNNSSSQTLYELNSKIYINDLNNLDLSKPISVVQLNNLIAGVANNKSEISINTALSTDDYNSLKKSNLLLEGSVVSREQGIYNLVRLYEIKTKSNYTNYTNINTTNFKDISSASATYQTSLLKAGELGFFGSETTARPKSSMTIEEALYMINIILQDSGY